MSSIVSSIRPDKLHQIYRRLQAREVSSLFRKRRRWPRRSCPLCGEKKRDLFIRRSFFQYVRCRDCHLVYLDPCPPEEELNGYYRFSRSASFFHERVLLPTERVRREIFESRLSHLNEFLKNGRLLEMGCSIGTFLKVARDKGWETVGVEPNHAAAGIARKRGFSIFGDLEEMAGSGAPVSSFNLVTAWEVIAHIREPLQAFKKIRSLLEAGGMIVTTTPNVQGIEYRLLGADHPNMEFPFLQLFSSETIKPLFQGSGLSLVRLETPGTMDIENICKFRRRGSFKTGWPRPLESLILGRDRRGRSLRQSLQESIAASGRSGHMLAVGRRP